MSEMLVIAQILKGGSVNCHLYLWFVLVPIGSALSDVGFLLCRTRAVKTCDVGFFLSLGLYLVFFRLLLEFRSFEGDAAHHGLRDFLVAGFSVSSHSSIVYLLTKSCFCAEHRQRSRKV